MLWGWKYGLGSGGDAFCGAHVPAGGVKGSEMKRRVLQIGVVFVFGLGLAAVLLGVMGS